MLELKKLRYKNFLSSGNTFISLQLNKCHKTIMTGASGSGKSTVLDAITFGLFNKPFRNINKGNLVNTVNKKDCVVEIEFSIGDDEYLIRRGIKPNIFEIYKNKNVIDQTLVEDYQDFLENTILKFNYKAFTQIIVLGVANFTPFMQMKPVERRSFIEHLLNIEIFSVMSDITKKKLSEIKDKIKETDLKLYTIDENIRLNEEFIASCKKKNAEYVKMNNGFIKDAEKRIEAEESIIKDLDIKIAELHKTISDKSDVQLNITKTNNILYKFTDIKKGINKDIKFYNDNHECPTCRQAISKKFRDEFVESQNTTLEKTERGIEKAKQNLDKYNTRMKEIDNICLDINTLQKTSSVSKNKIDSDNFYISKIRADIASIREISVEDKVQAISKLKCDKSQIQAFKDESLKSLKIHENVIGLLKDDGIKSTIIKHYIPLINRYINQYLGIMDFFVDFKLDNEFNDEIKCRQRDVLPYYNFSEGEKQRMDLAVLFAWRKIAKLKNKVNCNLLILDEIFDNYLDTTATENVINALNTEQFKENNVFVISHKEQIVDKFDKNIHFIKKRNFSSI